jgi:hypothetical protein
MRHLYAWALAVAVMAAPSVHADDDAPKACPQQHCDGWILSPCFMGDGAPLSSPVTSYEAQDAKLSMVLEQLRDLMNLPMVVDEEAIQERGIDLEQPVTVEAQNVPLSVILAQVLYPCGLSWEVKDDEVHILPQPHEEQPALHIGKQPIQYNPERLVAAARSWEALAATPGLSKAERTRLLTQACEAYNHALVQCPECEAAQQGLLALIAQLKDDECETPACDMPCDYGCEDCCEQPATDGKQEPTCYPEEDKCSADATEQNPGCAKAACCCGGKCGGSCPFEPFCSCCRGCVGCCIGSMIGCAVDHPLLGAWIGRCVSSVTPIEQAPPARTRSVEACPMAAPPMAWMPPPMPMAPPPPPPGVCFMPAPTPCPVLPPEGNTAWTLSQSTDGMHIAGPGVDGRCDSVSFGPDGCVMLNGHVRVRCHKDGNHTEIHADRLWVRLVDMSVQINPQEPPPNPYIDPAAWWGAPSR